MTKTQNEKEEIQINKWMVTRREVLKTSGMLVAGLSLDTPLVYGEASEPKKKVYFGMVTDMHYADADTRGVRHYRESLPKLEECVSFMNTKKVNFLIELGDLKDERPDAKEADTLTYLETIEAAFAKFEGPRYHVLGNHDMDSISKEQFLARAENTGITQDASYYSFDHAGVHCIVLDACYTTDGKDYDHGNFNWKDPNIPQEQCDWLKEDLASTTNPTLVFVHQLLDGETDHCVNNAAQVRKILQDSQKVLAVFHGHNHAGQYNQIEGIHYYTLKAVIEGSGKENNAYATVDVYDDHSIVVTGYRKAVSKTMTAD